MLMSLSLASAVLQNAAASAKFVPPLRGLRVTQPDALWCLEQYQQVSVKVGGGVGPMDTTYCRAGAGRGAVKLLFLHGADSNALEWRSVMRSLVGAGFDCTSLDWWSGGFTERGPIARKLANEPTPPQCWVAIRDHIHGFWKQQLDADPVVLIGTSLGGAVALDYAAYHPEAVSALVLIDAGGESYKAPSPDAVTMLAPLALQAKRLAAYIQERVPSEDVRLIALHRAQPDWLEAGAEYLRSGSYQRVVGPDLIKMVQAKTFVIWGEDDDILPVEDAAKFERDLPNCAGVTVIPGSGHSPQLDNPPFVTEALVKFLGELD